MVYCENFFTVTIQCNTHAGLSPAALIASSIALSFCALDFRRGGSVYFHVLVYPRQDFWVAPGMTVWQFYGDPQSWVSNWNCWPLVSIRHQSSSINPTQSHKKIHYRDEQRDGKRKKGGLNAVQCGLYFWTMKKPIASYNLGWRLHLVTKFFLFIWSPVEVSPRHRHHTNQFVRIRLYLTAEHGQYFSGLWFPWEKLTSRCPM